MIFAERFREYISLHTLYTTTFSNENIPPFRQKPEENRKLSKTYSVKSIFMPSRRKFFHNFRQNSCSFREFMLYLKRFPFGNQNAQIAQLVEQRTENPRVAGSIPALGIFCCTKAGFTFFCHSKIRQNLLSPIAKKLCTASPEIPGWIRCRVFFSA